MANDSELNVVLRLKDEFTRELRNVQGELGTFNKKLDNNKQAFKDWGKGITAVGVGLGALLVKTGLTSARVEVLGVVLENVGKVSGVSSDVLAEQEEVIKKLGITTKSARELLIRFMQGQLDVAQASKIARVAQDLAVISGQNSSEAAETLTYAIVSQNTVLLKQFGIVQSLNSIYDGYAEELEKSADDLTDVEKKQAFLNVILAEGKKVAGTYEAAMGKVGKQLTSLPRLIEEAEKGFGEGFLPVMNQVINTLSKLLKQFNALPKETKKNITQITILTSGISLLVGSMLLMIGYLPSVIAGFKALVVIGKALKVLMLTTVSPVAILALALVALGVVVYQVYKHWNDVKYLLIEIWEAIKTAVVGQLNEIKDVFMEVFNFFTEKIQNIWNLMTGLKGFIGEIGGLVGSTIRGVGLGLPHFQQGGIVNAPFGTPVPAIVHGGERIIPAGRSGGNITLIIEGNTFLDENVAEKIGDMIISRLKTQMRFMK